MNISVVGLGKLGLCTAACFAAKGHTVIGIDSDETKLQALRAKQCPVSESGLEDLLSSAFPNMQFLADYSKALNDTELTLIIVPTPSQADGSFTNEFVIRALEQLAPALAAKQDFHIVAVVSTVMPGSCDGVFRPLLEKLTGKRCGVDFGLVYNPEFIALGSVLQNFLNPDLVLIGASDALSANKAGDACKSIVTSEPTYSIMSLINAEITKLGLNCYVTMKISFANELAALCELIPGADIDIVSTAIGADSRVGRKYLTGGLGFGGPCFPRDNKVFQAAGERVGYKARLSPKVIEVNDAVTTRIRNIIKKNISPGEKVALFGIAYKQNTHVVEESQGIILADLLEKNGYKVFLHDPKALDEARTVLGGRVHYCVFPYEAANGAAGIILLANWPQFANYDWRLLEQEAASNALIFDSWRVLRQKNFTTCRYLALGIGNK